MNMKELKFYEAPACDVVELKFASSILAGSGTTPSVEDESEDDVLPGA